MEIHQLKTFVAVAREGSITRASERLYLSQPAISAHIKVIEDTLGITLFERTARGMSLTRDGQLILVKAEQTLGTHRELIDEAARIKGCLRGRLRLGAESTSNHESIGRLLRDMSERYPEVEVELRHGTSADLLSWIRCGDLDASFYHAVDEPDTDLATIEVSRFDIYLAAPPGFVAPAMSLDRQTLGGLPWIFPTTSLCCGRAAENLFRAYNFRPNRIINIDHENVTRMLLARGVGMGLLHADAAKEAQERGEANIVCEAQKSVRVLFAYPAKRAQNPLLSAVSSILRTGLNS